jgi:hypothetical protein
MTSPQEVSWLKTFFAIFRTFSWNPTILDITHVLVSSSTHSVADPHKCLATQAPDTNWNDSCCGLKLMRLCLQFKFYENVYLFREKVCVNEPIFAKFHKISSFLRKFSRNLRNCCKNLSIFAQFFAENNLFWTAYCVMIFFSWNLKSEKLLQSVTFIFILTKICVREKQSIFVQFFPFS